MKWLGRALAGLTVLAALIYGGITAYVYDKQGQIVYLPTHPMERTPRDYGLAYEELHLPVKRAVGINEGATENITAWWIPSPQPNGVSELFLHGNARNMSAPLNLEKAATLARAGFNVLAIDYRGYGSSEGEHPYEAALYEDAGAALDELERREPDIRKRLIHGHSLGGAIAIDLAVRRPEAAALVIESSFDSMLGMSTVRAAYRLLPINLILTERFDSIDKIGRIKLPLLFIHGNADPLVPAKMSERLYAAATASDKRLLLIDGGVHSNLHTFKQYIPAIRALALPGN
ncbi:MAG: alpha/beta hydrolase fold protein [Betaproteobacteria bacterium]|nr:alpha/beta hydrolase fold protein [Betaproteobacteria bacterium]